MVEREKNVMIIDSGSRGHAIAQNLREYSPRVGKINLVPGNAGTDFIEGASNLDVDVTNHQQIIEAAQDTNTSLVVIAPEDPLVAGIVDSLENANILTFGPNAAAARIEGSKAYAMQLLERNNIPIPDYCVADNRKEAHRFVDNPTFNVENGLVVKADGLAAGKAVYVTSNNEEAHEAVDEIILKRKFGNAGDCVVFQEKLSGFEISVMAIVDGERFAVVPTSEDHKQVFDEDNGPNTGGMGGSAPHPLINNQKLQIINNRILKPLVDGLKREGTPFKGVLYPALFWTKDGPKVIEVNCRFGGSEWEAISRLVNFDTCKIFSDAAKGQLKPSDVKFKTGSAISVALASKGYPGPYKKGIEVNGLDKTYKDVVVFHAGTKREDSKYLTNGGRVVFVTGVGGDIYEAREHAYGAIGENGVNFGGMHKRNDIGARKRNE